MIKGFIFDYGGTLDTAGRHWGKVIWHAYKKSGVPVTEQQFREAYVYAERHLGSHPVIKPEFTFYDTLDAKIAIQLEYLSGKNMLAHPQKSIDRLHKSILDSTYGGARQETARSREVLTEIKACHKMALVSNFYGNIGTVLHEFGFDGMFDTVIESAVVGIRKPDPSIFRLAVDAMGLAPDETIVVGDSYDKDIIPAKQAGCHAVWLKGEGWTDKTYDETIPDAVVTELRQTLNIEGLLRSK